MAFHKITDHIFFVLVLTVAVLTLPFVLSENIDCKGKAFYCVNSTHFKICVDFGGGVSKTVDDFQIPCPTNTVCRDINTFECELPVTTTLAPSQQGDATNEEVELSFTPFFEEGNEGKLLPEYKTEEKPESRSDNLGTTESSSSVTSEDTMNLILSTRLGESINHTTLSSENTIQYNKHSYLSDSVTVPYTSESGLNLVTNSDEFSTIITKIRKVNHTLQNSLIHNSSTNNTDDLSLEKPIQKIEGSNESTTEKNERLVKIINSANINIGNKNVYDNTTNLVPISTLTTETESLFTQGEISENDSQYFTESISVTNDTNIFTQSVIVSSNLNIENISNHSSVNVLNPVITTESYKTDREQTTKSNNHTVMNAIQLYNSTLNSDVLSFNSSKNNFTKDSVSSSTENLSNFQNTHINDTTLNSVSEPSVKISTYFTTTDADSDNLSDEKEPLSVLTYIPSIMSINETFDDSNEDIKSSPLTSTTPFYKYDSFITHITSTEYEQNFKQNITHVPDSIHQYTDNITTISGKQYLNNFTESETTTPFVDFLLKPLFNSTVTPIESDNVLTNPHLNSSKIEIPIKLHKINKTVHNEEISTDNLLHTNVDYRSYEKNISKTTDDSDVNDNETTLLNENTDADISLSVEIYNTSNSFESNLASLQETTINLKPRTNVTPLNISVNITSKTTFQYSSLPAHSTTPAVSEETSPTISVTETNTENNNYKEVDDNEVTENKTTLLIKSTFKVTTSLIEKHNSADTSKSNLASFQKTTIKLTPQNDKTSFNIDVDSNSKTTLQYTSFPKQLTSFSELHQNQTNSYSVISNPNIFATDTSIENNVHMVVDDRNNLESKIIPPNEIGETSTASLKDIYTTTESSDLILAPLPKTQNNLTPLIDVTPLSNGVAFNSRVTPQYISLFQQPTTNVISEIYINQENTYSVTTSPRDRGNKTLTTVAAPVYSSIAYKDKILDVPYSDKTSSAKELVIKINNTNNDYSNLHSSSLIDSAERSSINPFTKQALNMTTNSYISYTNSEKNQSQLDTISIEKASHTTPLDVDLNISNVSINKVNSTINSNLNNFSQSTIVLPFLKQDFTVTPFYENVDKIESIESGELTTIEMTNSNLFITDNTESSKMYPVVQNSSLITNPHVYHKENVTKIVSSRKEINLNRNNDKNQTSLDTDTNLPSISLNTLDSISEVQDHNMSSSQVIFKSGTIPETISFTTQVTKTFGTNVVQTTSHKITSNKYNGNVINTNSNYVNSNNLTAINKIKDDLLNKSHNVQKITQRTSNTSTLDTHNIISGLVNETTNEGFILSKIFKLSSNHSSLKYKNPLLSNQNGTNSNKKVSLLETNMNPNVSFKNDKKKIKNDLQQNTTYYYNNFEKQPIAVSILSSLSNESKQNILDPNSQMIPLLSQFSCFNRDRGKYSDKNNCTKFYICVGKLQPIYGMCPSNTVFSEINKQCTKNLSHCVRNNEFKCLSSGRFIDVLSENFYYICVKNLGGYTRFKLKCQKGYYLNKENIKCVCDSSSVESVSTTNSDVSTEEKISKEFKEYEKYTKQFDCIKEGKFEYPDDCRKYFVCKKGSKSQLRRKIKKCDSDEVFNKEKRKCVDSDTYEC